MVGHCIFLIVYTVIYLNGVGHPLLFGLSRTWMRGSFLVNIILRGLGSWKALGWHGGMRE